MEKGRSYHHESKLTLALLAESCSDKVACNAACGARRLSWCVGGLLIMTTDLPLFLTIHQLPA